MLKASMSEQEVAFICLVILIAIVLVGVALRDKD